MELIVLFVDICLFKKGPQHVPASRFLFGLALVAYWLVGIALLVVETDWPHAALEAFVESALLLGFAWSLLFLVAHKTERFLQAATALLATDALISTPGALLLRWWAARPGEPLLQLALLGLMIWHIAVVAHILRHALSRPLSYGFALSVLYVIVTYQLMSMIFAPVPAG